MWENLKTDNKGAMKYENRPEALRLDIIHLNSFLSPRHGGVPITQWKVWFGFKSMTWKLSEAFSGYINMKQFISAQSGPSKTEL